MTKIAILACLRSNDVCTGAACLEALNRRSKFFSAYEGQDVQLCAFYRCAFCGAQAGTDAGTLEKLERIVKAGAQAAHISSCAKLGGAPCPHMEDSARWLSSRGVAVVWGTH